MGSQRGCGVRTRKLHGLERLEEGEITFLTRGGEEDRSLVQEPLKLAAAPNLTDGWLQKGGEQSRGIGHLSSPGQETNSAGIEA